MAETDDFELRLETALSPYRESLAFIDELLSARARPQEIILLVCSRLDSLANLAFPGLKSNQRAYRKFISRYSGESRFFRSVSVGDLYHDLIFYGDFADGTLIDLPGRIHRYGRDSEHFLTFVEQSGVPVTGPTVRRLAHRVATTLAKYFRVKPRQRLDKPYFATRTRILEALRSEFRDPDPRRINDSLSVLIDRFETSSILYRRYRNQAIHGLLVEMVEGEFFSKERPYSAQYETLLYGTTFRLQYPAKYLRRLLATTLGKFTSHLQNTQSVPGDLFHEMYSLTDMIEGDALERLAEESLDDFEEVRWSLRTR